MDGMKTYRPYEFERWAIDDNHVIHKSLQMINLNDVRDFHEFGFAEDPKTKCVYISFHSGDGYVAAISYEDFKSDYFNFLIENEDIDPRSLKKKDTIIKDKNLKITLARFNNEILEQYHQLHPMQTIFHAPSPESIRLSIYEIPTEEDAGSPHLGDGVIYFN